jgi:hypothetical protein
MTIETATTTTPPSPDLGGGRQPAPAAPTREHPLTCREPNTLEAIAWFRLLRSLTGSPPTDDHLGCLIQTRHLGLIS